MIAEIDRILMQFRGCFSRIAAFNWFVIVIIGFTVRFDSYGVTSFIRWLDMNPALYVALLAFFRADSWKLSRLLQCWWRIVLQKCPLIKIDGRCLVVGDGIKISKEAKKMPGVKKMHQESSNSGKPSYITGHHHGVIGILAGWTKKKIFCVPLKSELHEGVKKLREFQGKSAPIVDGKAKVSISTLMASMALDFISVSNMNSLIVLDAYFSVGPVFQALNQAVDVSDNRLAHVITRAKKNVVAYTEPPPKTGKPGAPRKYGDKLKLMDIFAERKDQFIKASLELYGQSRPISFLCMDLMWRPVKEKIRFILVQDGEGLFILMCSDLTLSPLNIIRSYSYRFKIEVNFKVLKHVMGVFSYHFWTRVWPRLNKTENEVDITKVSDPRTIRLIRQAANAVEGFANMGIIALGLLQILAMSSHQTIWEKYRGWLRTIRSTIPSEEVTRSVIRMEYIHNFRDFSNTAIYRIIMSKNRKHHDINMPMAA